jgi:hypothetical protein
MNMPMANLVEKARAIRDSYKAKAESDPVRMIGQEAAQAFNTLLDESKKRYPESRLIKVMRPVTPEQTQLAGLLAKVDLLEDILKAGESA